MNTISENIAHELDTASARDREWLPRQREGLTVTPYLKRQTQEEIEASFKQRSSVCCYCGYREVASDNECGGCGAKRVSKRIITLERERMEAEIKGDR